MAGITVIKAGGGILSNASSISRLPSALERFPGTFILVVSAIGKTTNALQAIVQRVLSDRRRHGATAFDDLVEWHRKLAEGLGVLEMVEEELTFLQHQGEDIINGASTTPDSSAALSDSIISLGERFSSAIIGAFLSRVGPAVSRVNARDIVITDDTFGRAVPDDVLMKHEVESRLAPTLNGCGSVLTEGFIGSTLDGRPTTLGREGSDFTAALLASAVNADRVILFKDVPGVLTGDPTLISGTMIIPGLSYRQAQRLFLAGAKVVHPKTIMPLEKSGIPIHVVPYFEESRGTLIGAGECWSPGVIHAVAVRRANLGLVRGTAVPIREDSTYSLVTILAEPPVSDAVRSRVNGALRDAGCLATFESYEDGTWTGLLPSEDLGAHIQSIHDLVEPLAGE